MIKQAFFEIIFLLLTYRENQHSSVFAGLGVFFTRYLGR